MHAFLAAFPLKPIPLWQEINLCADLWKHQQRRDFLKKLKSQMELSSRPPTLINEMLLDA